MTYQVNVSNDGRLFLPVEIARALDLQPGDRLAVDSDGKLEVTRYADVVREGQDRFRAMLKEPFSVDEFLADRRAEAARE